MLLLRASSMGAKFVLLLLMARYFSFEEIGRYGLAVATVGILARVAGAEFYTVSNRQLVDAEGGESWRILNGHLSVIFLGLALVLPVAWVSTRVLELGVGWLMLHLILAANLIGTEAARVLVALGRPVRAYTVGAVMNAVWPLALVTLWAVAPGTVVLQSVWVAWFLGGLLGASLGILQIARVVEVGWRPVLPDLAWFAHGVRVSGFFLATAAAFRSIEFADRFVVQLFLGTAAVGVYTFYASFAWVLVEVGTVLVSSPFFPHIVGVMRSGTRDEARGVIGGFVLRSVFWAVVFAPLLFAGLWGASWALGREELWTAPQAYGVLLVGAVLLSASQGFHYALYGARRDGVIAVATVLAACVNLGVGLLLAPRLGLVGAAAGTAAAWCVVLLAKGYGVRQALGSRPVGAGGPVS